MACDLLIVAKDRPWLYDSLRRLRASTADVEIRVDRRRGWDRRRTDRTGAERRRRDIGDTLQTTGWALIRAAERPAPPSTPEPAS
jgi:hypothetical protein